MRLRGGPRRAAHAGLVAVVLVALAFLGCRSGDVSSSPQSIRVESSLGPLTLETVAEGLVTPWSVAFLPDGRFLVTERPGRMRVIDAEGHLSEPIAGLPKVHARGQGGLLDVVLAPDFASSRVIYFSYAEPVDDKARTAVMRARLDLEGLQLESAERIFAQHPAHRGNNHWGSRLVFGRDGMLFVTLGDRYDLRDQAQDLSSHIGKIVRLRPDGSVPGDNPLTTRAGTLPEIWSWGHRNIQGATLHPRTGELWIHEHGPRGGDEVNRILPGRNYGWPRITHGREYASGARIGEGTSAPDFESPLWQWTPSIAPSGMTFVTGERWGDWHGDLLSGSLAGERLVRLEGDANGLREAERLLDEIRARIRDVRQGPDGAIYLLDESRGRLLRLLPPRRGR
jgi:glucose/arabinose dehydrogenase